MAHNDMHSSAALHAESPSRLSALDWVALVLLIIGGLNWGLLGAIGIDLVAALLGNGSPLARGIYLLVGVAALYGLVMMARLGREPVR